MGSDGTTTILTLFALDVVLGDRHAPSPQDLSLAMRGHMIAQARLIGTCQERAH